MPRISQLTIDQVNRQLDNVDTLRQEVENLKKLMSTVAHSTAVTDPIHATETTNNIKFTWTGGSQLLSWGQGFIKDKNWAAQTTSRPSIISSAPGQQHIFTVPAGNLPLNPSTYYWLGWDATHQKMLAVTNADALHGDEHMHIICQLFTGTAGQTGTAGGGGSQNGVDLSKTRYKLF